MKRRSRYAITGSAWVLFRTDHLHLFDKAIVMTGQWFGKEG